MLNVKYGAISTVLNHRNIRGIVSASINDGNEMSAHLKELEKQIAQLSAEDQSRLMEGLIRLLDTGKDEDAESAWLQVAEQRYQEYRAGRLSSKSADLVFEEAQSKLR